MESVITLRVQRVITLTGLRTMLECADFPVQVRRFPVASNRGKFKSGIAVPVLFLRPVRGAPGSGGAAGQLPDSVRSAGLRTRRETTPIIPEDPMLFRSLVRSLALAAVILVLPAGVAALASPAAGSNTGCAGYSKPLNRAESFWRQAEERQVRACIKRFGAASSDNEENPTPLHLAAWFNGNAAVITALLEGGAEPNAKLDLKSVQGATPLHIAAQHSSAPAVVAALLEGGADPNAKTGEGVTPLHLAARFNNAHAVIAALLEGGAELNVKSAQGDTPLHLAADANSPAVVEALLKGGAEPNVKSAQGYTPLHLAADANSPAVVEALLKGGAEPNVKSARGSTPLHLAADANSPAVVEALLKGGAEPNARDKQSGTPLHQAALSSSAPALITALLKGGAEPNAKLDTWKGATPLHVAAKYSGVPAVIAALLKGGAEPNAIDEQGATPLLYAAQDNSNPAVVEALLEGGADPMAEAQGMTAFDAARNNPKLRGSDAYRRLREAHDAREAAKAAPDTLDLSREDYRAIQLLLNGKGFRAGPENGRWGSKSRSALRAFQAQGGLGQTGVPDKATRKALGFQESAESETRDVDGARDGVALRDACGVGQEIEPGQGCWIPGGGEFRLSEIVAIVGEPGRARTWASERYCAGIDLGIIDRRTKKLHGFRPARPGRTEAK